MLLDALSGLRAQDIHVHFALSLLLEGRKKLLRRGLDAAAIAVAPRPSSAERMLREELM
jgi:hypothetical protein